MGNGRNFSYHGYPKSIHGTHVFMCFETRLTVYTICCITRLCQAVILPGAFRFLVGFFLPGPGVQSFILISEFVDPKKRSLAGVTVFFLFYRIHVFTSIASRLPSKVESFVYGVYTTVFFHVFLLEAGSRISSLASIERQDRGSNGDISTNGCSKQTPFSRRCHPQRSRR